MIERARLYFRGMSNQEAGPTRRSRSAQLLPWIICLALFLTVAAVAFPAVGHATFLADQVDQILSFWAIFQGRPVALYGPVMSGTNPPVQALGPVCATILGLPIALRLNPDSLHLLLIVMLAGAAAALYRGLAEIDSNSALLWVSVILASPAFWWASSMIWAAIIPFWFSLTALAFLVYYVRSRSLVSAALFLACWLAGLCSHLTFVVTLPLLTAFLWLLYRDRPWRRSRRLGATLFCPVALLIPYCIGEARTGFANSRAILAHLTQTAGSSDHTIGSQSAVETLAIALDPLRLQLRFGWRCPEYLLFLWFLGLVVVAIVSLRWLRKKDEDSGRSDLFWSLILWVYAAGVLLQMGFFGVMNRPLLSWHYTLALLPLYPVPYVIITRLVLSGLSRRAGLAVGLVLSVGLVTFGATTASRFFESDSWNFRQTTAALSAICSECSSVNTVEDDGAFVPPSGAFETVLNFLIKKYVPTCHLSDDPDCILVPRRNGIMSSMVVQFGGREYRLLRTTPPGIGLYRRTAQDPGSR